MRVYLAHIYIILFKKVEKKEREKEDAHMLLFHLDNNSEREGIDIVLFCSFYSSRVLLFIFANILFTIKIYNTAFYIKVL
jgi:hypothetical protein